MVKSALFCFMPNVFRKFRLVRIFFVCERFDMIPVSLFECVCSHANVVLCVLCVAYKNYCFVYNGHAILFLQLQFSALMSCGWVFLIMRVL